MPYPGKRKADTYGQELSPIKKQKLDPNYHVNSTVLLGFVETGILDHSEVLDNTIEWKESNNPVRIVHLNLQMQLESIVFSAKQQIKELLQVEEVVRMKPAVFRRDGSVQTEPMYKVKYKHERMGSEWVPMSTMSDEDQVVKEFWKKTGVVFDQ